ncbi:MAG: hypothetical protein JL50_10140 [Peptococcaceae bacterium BICA1-7]|nr:MAG: hypothetical protein JL50_10140 [Peptococcaceae bacterium BICA1-7]HBV95643.1 hypothetical protein [Desulfotomaculum sp.]
MGWFYLEKVSEQLIIEIKKKSKEIDHLMYGEVILKIQDGRAVWGEIKTVWKADSNKREARA